ncbi:TPA: hypothetical protein ACTXXA_002013 [Legionella anisa]
MRFEAGGEPAYGFDSPFSGSPLPPEYPDFPAKTWFHFGTAGIRISLPH